MLLCRRENKIRFAVLTSALLLLCACPLWSASPGSAQSLKEIQEMTGDGGNRSEKSKEPPPSHGKMYKGYLVRQTALNHGSLTLYLCPDRWVLKTAFVTIIVDEEKDKLIAYTRQTNKYLADSLKVGQDRFNGFRRGGDFNWGKFTTLGDEKYLGMPCVLLQRKGTRTDLKTKTDVIITERQLCLKGVHVNKTLEEIGFALFDSDYRHGLPLKVSRMASSRNPHYCTLRPVITQDTTVFKVSQFPAREFEVPAGLTKVKSEIDLFSNDTGDFAQESSTRGRLKIREGQINVSPR